MIYVNSGFTQEERIGIIQNVQLDPSYYYYAAGDYRPGVHTGIYIDNSCQVSYKNIKINNNSELKLFTILEMVNLCLMI